MNTPIDPHAEQENSPRHRVRLPGFTADSATGLGDVVKRATSLLGIKPCGPCLARAERLNTWMVLSGPRK
ncbi:hypothetical protein FPZ12_003975 [Amycolatopsis acidicola]|uniref:Uncharacterized protein n=1 Tax=Amycolatopsis acidicola TaxID=2596893 RepID=A0A5N0VN96_9PSEU|nr:hypothetical protein [Amycolatopsis acidicola]KAA9166111.1 hypothetical protein FPZ12_003975 [Amycolatopsis acidicola]